MTPVVVGVDGGNSKTEVAVADLDGRVLGVVRGPGCSPDKLGGERSADLVQRLVAEACAEAGADGPVASVAALVAGLDLPEDAPEFARTLRRRMPGVEVVADNDTTAALLAGTGGGPGAVVVCGAGINAAAQADSGERFGFLSLGQLTGDWGGGLSLGREVLWHAVRAEDGRGEPTGLRAAVCDHFATASVREVALRVHRGTLAESRLAELVPALFDADAAGDATARGLIDRLVHELAVMAAVVLGRAGLRDRPAPVVLAGSVLTGVNGRLLPDVRDALAAWCPRANPLTLSVLPVAGAVIAALQAVPAAVPSIGPVARRVLASRQMRARDASGACGVRAG